MIKDTTGSDSSSSSERPRSGEKEGASKQEGKLMTNHVATVPFEGNAVVVKNGAFGYDTSKEPILSGINVEVPAGKFTMIVGPVGCGKSTLLKAILGEVSIMEGTVEILNTEVAYCDQTPWHMNGTVRDSIIAFSGTDEPWYKQVLEACALEQDLGQLPKGDLTTIGSKGIVLSGGQSQRIVSGTPWCFSRFLPS
jgi:ABC-type bacteriocin/lantibiotic exporter with double-glycine peptidase domain